MITPNLTSWRAQYERMLRGFERLQRPYWSSVEYQDDLQHFLQDCWHLKDWIRNDPSISTGNRIEDEVKRHEPLMVVADLANACKHLNHDRTDRTGSYATGNDVTVYMDGSTPADITYRITKGDGQVITARELIEQAAAAWDTVLRRVALIP